MTEPRRVDLAVVGSGAAGLMTAISAGRAARNARVPLVIVALDGARTLGAKILVAGGGRCNVTHDVVDAREYAGSTTGAIRKVLKRFTVADTTRFFADLGVTLKREDTGKLFPTTDKARTVLDALLDAASAAGVALVHPWRVESVERAGPAEAGFLIRRAPDESPGRAAPMPILARRIVLCTGGRSLPRSGSDGRGHDIARALGHTVTPRVFPALVPLVINHARSDWLKELSGLACEATLEVRAAGGKRLKAITGSTLCTHFGLSGPAPMDISRYYTDAVLDDPGATLVINWLIDVTMDEADRQLQALGAGGGDGTLSVGRFLMTHPRNPLPARLIDAIRASVGIDPSTPARALTREQRKDLARALTEMRVHIHEDRGWNYAEVTAGGVPLDELNLDTMESRITPGLHMAGEICDVDGRIGGYNFQWAWASGFVAGSSAAAALLARSGASQ